MRSDTLCVMTNLSLHGVTVNKSPPTHTPPYRAKDCGPRNVLDGVRCWDCPVAVTEVLVMTGIKLKDTVFATVETGPLSTNSRLFGLWWTVSQNDGLPGLSWTGRWREGVGDD